MTPKVRTVRQRLIIDLEHNVLYAVRVCNLCAERQVIRDLPQAAVVGADAKFFFGAAHAVRFIACNFCAGDLHAGNGAAFAGKGNKHALAHVWCAAYAVIDLVACINLQEVQFFGIRVVFDGNNARNNNIFDIAAHIIDVFDLCSGKRELVNQLFKVQTGKINEVVDPVH